MDNEEKLNLKIVALKEAFVKRVEGLDDEVANLRVALTEMSGTLKTTQQEFEAYRNRNPEGTDVQEETTTSTEE